jgi:hypothetical protein
MHTEVRIDGGIHTSKSSCFFKFEHNFCLEREWATAFLATDSYMRSYASYNRCSLRTATYSYRA